MSNLSVRQAFQSQRDDFFLSLISCGNAHLFRSSGTNFWDPHRSAAEEARDGRGYFRVLRLLRQCYTFLVFLWRRLVVAPLARAAPPPLLRIFWGVARSAAMLHFSGVPQCSSFCWCIEVYMLDLRVTVTKKIFQTAPSPSRLGCRRWRRLVVLSLRLLALPPLPCCGYFGVLRLLRQWLTFSGLL